jgi:hypothetical protein
MLMENKYLEKVSSLLATGAAVHLAQNAATKYLLKSPRFAKSVGNSFVDGVKGVVNTSKLNSAKNFVGGMISPDAVIAKNTAHKLGSSMAPALNSMNKRQLAALRMASKGNVSPLIRRGLHKDPMVLGAAKSIQTQSGIPMHSMLSKAEGNAPKIKAMFNNKDLPLLSNISKGIGNAKGTTGASMKPGVLGKKSLAAGSLTSAVLDPVAGAINTAKTFASSERFAASKLGGKFTDKVHQMLIKSPIQKGFNSDSFNKLKNKAYEYSINPVSANLERTTHAVKSLR